MHHYSERFHAGETSDNLRSSKKCPTFEGGNAQSYLFWRNAFCAHIQWANLGQEDSFLQLVMALKGDAQSIVMMNKHCSTFESLLNCLDNRYLQRGQIETHKNSFWSRRLKPFETLTHLADE